MREARSAAGRIATSPCVPGLATHERTPGGRRSASPVWARTLLASAFFIAANTHAATLVCHVGYGGETTTLRQPELASVAAAHVVKPQAFGSYFLFRPVFEPETVKLYTYADHPDGPLPLHVARHAHPAATRSQDKFGFTGEQRVYEPIRDSELVYWCEIER